MPWLLALSGVLAACRGSDSLPLEAVPLPPSAYGPFDGGVGRSVARMPDAAPPKTEAIVCEPQPEDEQVEGPVDDEIEECPARRGRVRLNRSVTQARRRTDPTACCYGGWDGSRKKRVLRVDDME